MHQTPPALEQLIHENRLLHMEVERLKDQLRRSEAALAFWSELATDPEIPFSPRKADDDH